MPEFQVRTTITTRLDDSVVFEEVDGKMMATVRILKAGKSKNKRTYPPHVVKEAVEKKVFDQNPMFIDHDRKRGEPQQRSVNEMVSVVESTSYDETTQSALGRVQFFDRSFYEKLQHATDHIGVSINSMITGERRTVAGEVQEDVTGWGRGRSVDWVLYPAAGGQILAFEDEDDNTMSVDWSKLTPEELKKNNPALFQAIQESAEPVKEETKKPKVETTSSEPVDIAKVVAEAIAEERKKNDEKAARQKTAADSVRDAFKNSGLPQRTQARVMQSFEGVEEYKEQDVADAIKNAKEELESAGAGPRIRNMGPTGGEGKKAPATFSAQESIRNAFGMTADEKEKEEAK